MKWYQKYEIGRIRYLFISPVLIPSTISPEVCQEDLSWPTIIDKNINTDPRQTHGETNVGGVKYRVLGENTSDMKNRSFKIRKK